MPLSWGCLSDLSTPERRKKGLVIVLPGIEGRSVWNYNLARGLNDGGIDCAIELFPWGTKVPGGFLLNLADEHRNRIEAERLRDYLIRYQQTHPGRSVHLVGHSGGAGLAVMATERLPLDAPVTSVTLLAAAISPSYDLRSALRRTELGILNCYSGRDSILLGPGTILVGTIDRQHVEAAGKVGFDQPDVLSKGDEGLFKKLRQVPWTPPLRQVGHDGGHFGWTNRHFVRNWLAPSMKGFIDRVHPITK
ncbi:MAG: hypothetical protein MI923_06055 [Phycisphaerales bacterium]|nr:hypothetical protein [Phycisphaerales bacterium]